MTFWSLTSYSDFPTDRTFHQFHDLNTELDLHRITSSFFGAFANGYGMPAGNAYPSGHLFMLDLLRPDFSNLPCLYSTFHHIHCQASIYTLSLCRGHSWRVRLAKQETLTSPGHLVSPLVCRDPWISTVVLYCWCHSDSASVLLYFTWIPRGTFSSLLSP